MGLQQTWQSSTYSCSETEVSISKYILSQQYGQTAFSSTITLFKWVLSKEFKYK